MRSFVVVCVLALSLMGAAGRLQAAVSSNGNISLVSPISVTPSATAPGIINTFSAVATDSNSLPLTYTWNFGDGTSAKGATVTHVYTAPGAYTVTLTVTDTAGGTLATSIVYSVLSPAVGTFADSDGDGVPDELEVFLGTSPFDANSTPVSQIRSFTINSLNVHLQFAKKHRDTVSISGSFPAPGLTVVTNQTMTFDIGGILRQYVLDTRGRAQISSNANFAESLKVSTFVKFGTKNVRFALKLRGDFQNTLAVDGMTNATVSATLPFRSLIVFQKTLFDHTVNLHYAATKGRSGRATFNKNLP
jgi:PKD repeat protein